MTAAIKQRGGTKERKTKIKKRHKQVKKQNRGYTKGNKQTNKQQRNHKRGQTKYNGTHGAHDARRRGQAQGCDLPCARQVAPDLNSFFVSKSPPGNPKALHNVASQEKCDLPCAKQVAPLGLASKKKM